ncbi:hypothetical protein FACS1894184_20810 [Clostridia bacterium]|nr:hypothetical protein FACS1894184_20810 [Clostridia bacterium]
MGGMALPAVMRFGYGFIQGADYAAKELGISGLTVNYYYTGGFSESPEVQSTAAAWYSDGVEVIFGCGGSLGYSVMKAAEGAPDKWVVGVDVDQSNKSERVIISAAKGLRESVYQAIDAAYKDEFPGGESWVLGADRDGVSLPMASSKLRSFSQADYDAIYAKLVAGEIAIKNETAAEDASALSTDAVTVTVVK